MFDCVPFWFWIISYVIALIVGIVVGWLAKKDSLGKQSVGGKDE